MPESNQRTVPDTSTTPMPQGDGGNLLDAGLERWQSKTDRLSGDGLWDLIGQTSRPRGMDLGSILRNRAMSAFLRDVGARYHRATLDNFVVTDPRQEKALALVRAYLERLDDHVAAGNGLILYGPVGTGKDHLAISAGRGTIARGYTVGWQSAQTIFADFRDSFSDDSGQCEADLLRNLLEPDVLIVSDPVSSHGELTDFQGNTLYRLVDLRYCERKPTWTTLNVADVDEAERRVGPATIDRLTHGATAVFCNWPSFRKPGR